LQGSVATQKGEVEDPVIITVTFLGNLSVNECWKSV